MGSKAIGKTMPKRTLARLRTLSTNTTQNMIEARDFPVGHKPGWELEQSEPDQENPLPLKSAADR
jgi:hypothetical protein